MMPTQHSSAVSLLEADEYVLRSNLRHALQYQSSISSIIAQIRDQTASIDSTIEPVPFKTAPQMPVVTSFFILIRFQMKTLEKTCELKSSSCVGNPGGIHDCSTYRAHHYPNINHKLFFSQHVCAAERV